jgi:hypothetical protein
MNNFFKILVVVILFITIVNYFQIQELKKAIGRQPAMKTEEPTNLFEEKPPKEVIYIGNRQTLKFHLPDCEWAKKISPKNRVYFKSKSEALKRGYQPCKVCRP